MTGFCGLILVQQIKLGQYGRSQGGKLWPTPVEKKRIKNIELQLKEFEKKISRGYTDSLMKQICDLKFQTNDIYNTKAEYALFRLKSNFYESGEKSGKLLARQLYQKEISYSISVIKNERGDLVANTRDSNKVFANFYDQLYKSEVNPGVDDYTTFFSKIKLP